METFDLEGMFLIVETVGSLGFCGHVEVHCRGYLEAERAMDTLTVVERHVEAPYHEMGMDISCPFGGIRELKHIVFNADFLMTANKQFHVAGSDTQTERGRASSGRLTIAEKFADTVFYRRAEWFGSVVGSYDSEIHIIAYYGFASWIMAVRT